MIPAPSGGAILPSDPVTPRPASLALNERRSIYLDDTEVMADRLIHKRQGITVFRCRSGGSQLEVPVGDIEELGIVGNEDEILYSQAFPDDAIRQASSSQRDDVIDVVSGFAQTMVQQEGEVLVEENLHEAFCTAGGR